MKSLLTFTAATTLAAALAMAQPARYSVIDLGPVGLGQPYSITNNDLVAGGSSVADRTVQAVLWYKGQKLDMGTLGLRGTNSMAYSVNETGQIVGQTETWTTNPDHEDFCGFKALGMPTYGSLCLAFLWQNGLMIPLPTLGAMSGIAGQNAVANMINSQGQVAGISENSTPDATCPAPQKYQFKPVLWTAGKVQELPTFPGDPEGVAFAINESAQVVGASGTCADFSPNTLVNLHPLHALLWQNGTVTDLGNLGGSGHGAGIAAQTINNKGQVVGYSDLPKDATFHAFLWSKSAGMADLGTLPGDAASAAVALNDGGEVTGVSLDANFNPRAFHWQNGTMADLNALIPSDSPLYLLLACSINSRGEIIGLAVTAAGEPHGYQLIPNNPATTANNQAVMGEPVTLTDALRQTIRRTLRSARLGFALPDVR